MFDNVGYLNYLKSFGFISAITNNIRYNKANIATHAQQSQQLVSSGILL
jgi:hypothetical protein